MTVYYTVINSLDYISSDKFNWIDMMNIITDKLSPKFKVCEGTNVKRVEFFLNAYDERPIFISVDGRSPRDSGQLFTLVDMENDPDGYNTICTTDPGNLSGMVHTMYNISDKRVDIMTDIEVKTGCEDTVDIPPLNLNDGWCSDYKYGHNKREKRLRHW